MKRRDFVKLGAGVVILTSVNPLWAFQSRGQLPRLNYPADFNAYLHFGEDGHITCLVGKIEMGQGNKTSLAQLVAEELGVAFESVELVMGDTDVCPWDLGTFGSMSIAVFGPVLRRAATEARVVLKELAAERLKVPASELQVRDGAVFDPRHPETALSFGSLAQGQTISRHVSVTLSPSDPSSLAIVGQSTPRVDGIEKVTGRAKYTADLRLPGMLYASILRPPAHGATLTHVDTSAAAKVDGAMIVREGDLVAALHEHPDVAAKARALIKADFDRHAPSLNDRTIFEHLVQAAPAGQTVAEIGSLGEGRHLSTATFDQTYLNAYVAHAAIETHSALASFENGRVTVWASAQAPFMVKAQVAEALGLPPDRVRIVVPYVGGGFGGKTMAAQGVEAARLSRLTGRPVQVVYDRQEEFFYDTFRPAAIVKLRSGVDASGHIALWDADVYGAGDGGAAPFYDIPHQRVVAYGGWQVPAPGQHPFGVGAWRAPAFNSNAFARELHMDLMASGLGIDPLTFRLQNLRDPRMRRVLESAAQRFGWVPAAVPSRRGIGMACSVYSNTYVAMFAQVSVDRVTGQVHVGRIVCAQDMGLVVNPDGARSQVEGCIAMGVGSALWEEVHFADGAIVERNFDTYQLPLFSSVPSIDVVLVEAAERPAAAGGEPAIPCVAAALGNAIHDAIGVRVLQLPMTPLRIKAALAASTADRKSVV